MIFRRVPGHFLPVRQGVFSKDSINNRTFRLGEEGFRGHCAEVSLLSGCLYQAGFQKNVADTCFIDTKTKGDVLGATKRSVSVKSANE